MLASVRRSFSFLPSEIVIVSAKRSAIGSFMGSLSSVPAPSLASSVIKSSLSQSSLSPSQVTQLILGNVLSSGVGQSPARQACLLSGLPETTISTGINKLCASGLKSVALASQSICIDPSQVVVAGGMENMSLSPFILQHYRGGHLMSNINTNDSIMTDGLTCPFNHIPMGGCAEKTAAKYKITREKQDLFCVRSYQKAAEAWENKAFDAEIAQVEVISKKGKVLVAEDEEFRKVKFDKIISLKPVFDKKGTITAANASKINDGACALVLMTSEKAKQMGCRPLARILSFADSETEPVHFGIAPFEAMKKAIQRAGIEKQQVDLFEINEAFSAVALANIQLMEIEEKIVNVNGGAVALGHPIGMSGARILTSLIYALRSRNKRIGVAGICNGGGGATAMTIEVL